MRMWLVVSGYVRLAVGSLQKSLQCGSSSKALREPPPHPARAPSGRAKIRINKHRLGTQTLVLDDYATANKARPNVSAVVTNQEQQILTGRQQMKNLLDGVEILVQEDFDRRTERIGGPEVQGFSPTLQELIQLVKLHIKEFVEMRWYAFTAGRGSSAVVEEAIWVRLDKIRRVLRDDDFKNAVKIACMEFGFELDARIWNAFVYGDEDLLRDTALEMQRVGRVSSVGFSELLGKRIFEAVREEQHEVPREVLRRIARPILDWREEESGLIQ
jgi:hypothetical protein